MNKEELFELASTLDISKEEYCILSGGALVSHGLREQTNDLDIDITPNGFELLKKKFNIKFNISPEYNKCIIVLNIYIPPYFILISL